MGMGPSRYVTPDFFQRSEASLSPVSAYVVQWTTFHELKEYKFAVMVRGMGMVADLRAILLELDYDLISFWPFSQMPEHSKGALNSTRRFWKSHPNVKREFERELWAAGWEDRL